MSHVYEDSVLCSIHHEGECPELKEIILCSTFEHMAGTTIICEHNDPYASTRSLLGYKHLKHI